MSPDEDEKQADMMIGEAVIALIDGDVPVTSASLLMKLQSLLMTENDARRKKAIFCAIREVRTALSPPGERGQHGTEKARNETSRLLDAVLNDVIRKH